MNVQTTNTNAITTIANRNRPKKFFQRKYALLFRSSIMLNATIPGAMESAPRIPSRKLRLKIVRESLGLSSLRDSSLFDTSTAVPLEELVTSSTKNDGFGAQHVYHS